MKAAFLLLVFSFAALRASFAEATAPDVSAPSGYTGPKIYDQVPAQFPVRALQQGIRRGEARIMLEIDSEGTLRDLLVIAYSRREFADEATYAVKQWRFGPGSFKGEPVTSILDVTFEFELSGVLVHENRSVSLTEEESLSRELIYRPHGVRTLDRVPAALHMEPPIYPREWIQHGRTGTVTVQFFIDEEGRPRVPTLKNMSDPLLAGAAISAIKAWRFEPPTHQGRPVLVHAEQDFVFRPKVTPTP